MPRVVVLFDHVTGTEVTVPSATVAMGVPRELPVDRNATVSGDAITFVDGGGVTRVVSSPTRSLREFDAGEDCLRPTDLRDAGGRTLWVRSTVVRADHLARR